jgi:hypothetical protein
MKKIIFIPFIAGFLFACSDSTDTTTTPPLENVTGSTNPTSEPTTSETSTTETNTAGTLNYFDYVPKNELEEEYFKMIANLQNANSYESEFTYESHLFGEDDLNEEIYSKDRVILSPFQLHRTYSSISFRNDNFELYVNENEGFIDSMFEGWEEVEDPSIYKTNSLPSRTELMLALIDLADEVYEVETGEITFSIQDREVKAAARLIQLTFFHDVANLEAAKTDGTYDLVDDYDQLESIMVTIKVDENTVEEIEIYIYLDRVDEDTVNYHYFKEEYDDINQIKKIDIPAEVYQ